MAIVEDRAVLVITGPTAVGKSELALAIATHLGGELISADSAQVYRGLNIGTAKPSEQERRQVPHHLIDIRDPVASFTVAEYRALALAAIEAVWQSGRRPIVVGGTGLYIRQLFSAHTLPPVAPHTELRAALYALATEQGPQALFAKLMAVDPEAASIIPPGHVRRVVRALEVLEVTGQPISAHWRNGRHRHAPPPYRLVVCTRPRQELHRRIGLRTEAMLSRGLVSEVEGLLRSGVPTTAQSMQALGYKETVDYLAGIYDEQTLRARIDGSTRQYAKRQMTWWRHEPGAIDCDLGEGPAAAYRDVVERLCGLC